MSRTLLILLVLCLVSCQEKNENKTIDFSTTFEKSKGLETPTYEEVINFYKKLSQEFSEIHIQAIGETDSGEPLHIVTFNGDADFNFDKIKEEKTIVLINNGIHPGESDGIDATMLLFRDLANGTIAPPQKTVLVTIPIYNIGGALNRNTSTRANQNGPISYGFRGNAKNYDLNRDFIKSDTKNAKAFAKIYHLVQPAIFIDNHVSNGADYQYTLTHLFTQHNKLGGRLGDYIHNTMMPALQDSLLNNNWDITPYVNVFNRPPETGFQQFMDYPRYSTGYTTLWNTLGMMVETHMLKPYKNRVEGTYTLMKKMIAIAEVDGERIRAIRENEMAQQASNPYYTTRWEIDTNKHTKLSFKGFKADTITSEVTGLKRLKYNQGKPFTKEIVYQDYYQPADSVTVPKAYVIEKQWLTIIDLLRLNRINFTTIPKDTILEIDTYRIESYETVKTPYEGHYLHYNTKVSSVIKNRPIAAGGIIVNTDQPGFRYLMETLEPTAVDSFFNWNFFDTILQQKEGFSPYVFEDTALQMLQTNPELKTEFELKKENETDFAQNWYAQLSWLFKRSNHYEPAHMQYPIFRILSTD